MVGLVDIHSHLLPGIDDGPDTLEESLDMARAAVAAGITTIAATPHLRADFPGVHIHEIADRCEELEAALDEQHISLRVVSGAEASLTWALEASDEELRLATYGQQGTDLLVETPYDPSMLEQLLHGVRTRGVRVTLGHPERSLRRDPERLEALVTQGVLLQINADALLAPRTSGKRRIAEHLCRAGLASVVASDGHRGDAWRPVTALGEAAAVLVDLVGTARAEWMTSELPHTILSGAAIPEPPAVERAQRSIWRLFARR